MSSRLEEDWKTLWCPRAFPIAASVSGVASANRRSDGAVAPACLCIGSACAAFWYDKPRPEDGYEYLTSKVYGSDLPEHDPDKYVPVHPTWAHKDYEFVRIDLTFASDTPKYRNYEVTWRKPWKPLGFCAAFPHPDRFPVSES